MLQEESVNEDAMRSLFMNRSVQSMQLLNAEICIVRKEFIHNHAFTISPHTGSSFEDEFSALLAVLVFIGTKPIFLIVYADINALFFLAGNNALKRCVPTSTPKLVTRKKTGSTCGTFKFVAFA